jgi:uncharacterized membrane protein
MDKKQVLDEISVLAKEHQITREELMHAFDSGALGTAPVATDPINRHINISDVLYYIGGAIIFIGIAILVGQNWDLLNTVTKILVTLGSAVAAYVIGVAFYDKEKYHQLGQAFFFLSALLMPLGILVTMEQTGFDSTSLMAQTIASALSFVVYLLSYYGFKRNVFVIFNIIFGTWLFYSITNQLLGETPYFDENNYFMYRAMVVGISYMLLGYYFSDTEKRPLSGPLYAFGSLAFLGSTLILQGFEPEQSAFWEIIYPVLVFAIIFLSTKIKSKAFLTFGAIFLMAYILKITGEYFSQGLGWPASLVIAGLALMAVGYYSVWLKRRYIS